MNEKAMYRVGPQRSTEKNVFLSLNHINTMVLVMRMQCILCEVETEFISCAI
jgi:hypothetical protein